MQTEHCATVKILQLLRSDTKVEVESHQFKEKHSECPGETEQNSSACFINTACGSSQKAMLSCCSFYGTGGERCVHKAGELLHPPAEQIHEQQLTPPCILRARCFSRKVLAPWLLKVSAG